MLDLEYATDAVSNADLDEAMVGAPVAAPPAVERRTSVVAGHRLMVPGPSYAAMEEAYKDMYAEYYYPDGTLRPDAYDRWGYDSGSYEAYRGDDRDPTVVLPADDKNGSAVVLTAFSNDPAEAGATAPRRAVSFAAAVGDGRRNGAGGSGADAPAATKPKRAMGPRKGSDPTPSPTTKVEGSPHSPSSPGKRRSGAADAPSSASSIGAPAAVPLGMSEGEVIRGSSDVPPEWVEEQKRLAAHAILDDSDVGFVLPWDEKPMVEAPSLPGLEHCPPSVIVTPDGRPPAALRVVGGLDISFLKDTNIAVASLVIMEYPSLRVLHTEMLHTEMNVPYVAGFLAFREVKPLQDVIAAAKLHYPSAVPQLYLVDGNGALHFRKCGLATHLGVLIGAPTIGVAKKLLNVDGLANDDSAVERIKAKAAASGKSTAWDAKVAPLIGRSGQTWGYGALTGNSTAKPVFISAGHRLSHLTAARLALSMAPYRVIEPIRQADLGSRAYIKKHFEDKASDAPAAPPSSSTAAA